MWGRVGGSRIGARMASYHFAVQVIRRSEGRSAIKAAAYRAGARLKDQRSGEVYDFSRRRGVAHAEVMLPEGAPDWLLDRERLWNTAEAVEKRRDAQLAREINMALPHEVSAAERLELVRTFVREQFVARGMVADIALHEPVLEKGDDPRNFHAHVMLTLRQGVPAGLRAVKTREWNSDALLDEWRAAWSAHQNRLLERAGKRERVDHRTLAAQRAEAQQRGDRARAEVLDREPEIHIGPQAAKAAEHDRKPRSRDRQKGPVRDRPEGRGRRTVFYTRLDQGSRLERNRSIIEGNLARTERSIARWSQRAARFRSKRQWLSREEFEAKREQERLAAASEKRRLWQRQKDREAFWASLLGIDRKVAHLVRRRGLLDTLLGPIDQLLAAMMGIRTVQYQRRNRLKRRYPARERPPRSPGRGRGRSPGPGGDVRK